MPEDLVNKNVDHIFDVTEDDESDGEWEPDEEDAYDYALLQGYYEGNLLILN